MPDMSRPRQTSEDIRLKQHLTNYENQIKQKAFKKAAVTNKEILKILTTQKPETTHWEVMSLKQARAAQALLNQILTDRTRERELAEQIRKTGIQLKQKEQSVESLKTLIKNLNQTIKTLENQTTQLEKQIERIKQIDLK